MPQHPRAPTQDQLEAIGDNQPSLAIGSIALDPKNPDIVYLGTGEQNFSGNNYYGVGDPEIVQRGSLVDENSGSVSACLHARHRSKSLQQPTPATARLPMQRSAGLCFLALTIEARPADAG